MAKKVDEFAGQFPEAPHVKINKDNGAPYKLYAGIAGVTVLAVGGVLAAYFLSPAVHGLANTHLITPFKHATLTQKLLIASPIGAGVLATVIYKHRTVEHPLRAELRKYTEPAPKEKEVN